MGILKKVVIIIVSIVAIMIIALVVFLEIVGGGFIFLVPNYNKMDKVLKANIDNLSFVIETLSQIDHNYVEIRVNPLPLPKEDKYSMSFSNGLGREVMSIPFELLEPVERLDNSGIQVISSGRNSASFSLWSSLSESRGIIYSKNGETPWSPQYIDVRQLSVENWYYYVNNFEKARARNPHLFQ